MKDLEKAIDALVQRGKLRGRLTHDQIIDALFSFDIGPDTFDEILQRLANESIEVIDDADDSSPEETVSPKARAPGRIEFEPSARELLKWAHASRSVVVHWKSRPPAL